MKYFYHLLFALFICIFSKEDYKEPETNVPGYESLLKWGKSNNLRINKNIRFIKDKYTKQYSAKESISKGEVILDIPPDCMININKALKLLNSKKYRKAYNSYIEADKINLETFKDKYHAEKAFMSYILYIVNHKKNYFEKNKNKFYEYYKPMEYAFEENLDSLPFFFSSEQMKFFLNTSFGSVFEIINSYINEEVSIFYCQQY